MSVSNFQSSFIPKGVGGLSATIEPRKGTGFFGTIIVLLFILTLLTTAGLIAYKQIIKGSIVELRSELALAESTVDTESIDKMFAFSKKLTAAKGVVMRHRVVSNFLRLLEENTLQSVSFREFNYQFMPEGDINIILNGQAGGYSSLASQEGILSKIKDIKSVNFSELSLTEGGLVSFKLSILIDPSSAIYATDVVSNQTEKTTSSLEDTSLTELDLEIPDLEDL
ncbi:MAG: hypothetical protein AAB392_00365 [Patescibacteria group bacterium]